MTRRWFPGYDVAAVAALATALTAPGQTFVVSQLNTSLREAFGLSELLLNASYTVATVLAALPLVLTGRLTDRFGPRRTLAVVALLFGLGCLALSAAQGPVTLCLAFFCLRFFGQGSLSLVSQHAVAMWFHARLGRIHGISQVAVFGLWTFAPPLTVALIASVGWRGTYVVFALLIWLLVIPAALLVVRDRPEELGLALDGGVPTDGVASSAGPELTLREASRTRIYWILATLFVIGPLVGTGVLFDIQPLLGARDIDAAGAAWAVSAFSLATGVMALPAGWLTDRFRPAPLLTVGMMCVAGSAVGLLFVSRTGEAAAAVGLFAIGQIVVGACGGATVARAFGRTHHGAIRSSLTRLAVVGTGLGPLATAASVAITGTYDAALIGFAALGALGVAAAPFVTRGVARTDALDA